MDTQLHEPRTRGPTNAESKEAPQAVRPVRQERNQPVAESKPRRFPRLLGFLVFLGVLGGLVAWRYSETSVEAPAILTLQGNVDVRQVNLSFKVGGRIESLAVDEGDTVKAGQIIASLDQKYFDDDLRLAKAQNDQAAANLEKLKNGSRPEEIEQARAAEAEAQASVTQTEGEFRRAERLIAVRALSAEEFDQRKASWLTAKAKLASAMAARKLTEIGPRSEDIAAARAQLEQAAAQVIVSERRIEDSRLIAPNDGIILTRAREKGSIVNAGDVAFTLTLASPVWVRTYVGEPDLGAVQSGMAVAVRTDAAGGRAYAGHIGFVSPTAEFTPKSVETKELRTDLVYRLRVVVDDPDGGLRQGMPVTVTVQLPGPRQRTWKERLIEALWLDRLGLSAGGKP